MRSGGLEGAWDAVFVAFSDDTDIWFLRGLRHGFRHCYVVLARGNVATVVEPLSNRLAIYEIGFDTPDDLLSFFEARGDTLVRTYIRKQSKFQISTGFFTCVEVAKRILNIRSRRILTPWRLYRYLRKERNDFPLHPKLIAVTSALHCQTTHC